MSSTALKFLALGLMLIDHIYEFFPGMPVILTILGRISAPLFFFLHGLGLPSYPQPGNLPSALI